MDAANHFTPVHIQDLFSGTMITLTAYPQQQEHGEDQQHHISFSIPVPRGLITVHSTHFNTVFNSTFTDSDTLSENVSDVEPWVLRTFVAWLYTQQLAYHEGPNRQTPATLAETVESDWPYHESTPNDPVTWSWQPLLNLYKFADEYDTCRLRQFVFEKIRTKVLQVRPKAYELPGPKHIAYIAENLPPSSPLRKFFVQVYVHAPSFHEHGAELSSLSTVELEVIPGQFLAEAYRLSQRRTAAVLCYSYGPGQQVGGQCMYADHTEEDLVTPRERAWCWLHEHEGDEEVKACEARWWEVEWRLVPKSADEAAEELAAQIEMKLEREE